MEQNKIKNIYLDHAGSTPIDKTVLEKMYQYDKNYFANPSGIYNIGRQAHNILEEQRLKIARIFQCRQSEIYFTSGGTESDNLALMGTILAWKENNKDSVPEIIVSAIEHAAVLDCANNLKKNGVIVHIVYPNKDGLLKASEIKELINKNTVIISVMLVNNEIGTIQPVGAIGRLVQQHREETKSKYPLLHTDACQAGNYLPVLVPSLRADLVTVNASKLYGPKSVGVLFIKSGTPIQAMLYGGGQEKGMRSGTENVSLAIGMAESLIIAQSIHKVEAERVAKLQAYFFERIKSSFPQIKINGCQKDRIPNNINLLVPGIQGEELVIRLASYGISVSSKSTCSSIDSEGSYVILAIGGSSKDAEQSIRITMGRETTQTDLEYLLDKLEYIIKTYTI